VLISILAMAGCGSEANRPVPDVVGERLDVAKSTMNDGGYDTEAIGGGTFGIVVESNWTVCETEPPAGATADGKVKLIVDRACNDATTANSEQDASPAEPTAEPTPKPKRKRKRRTSTRSVASTTVPDVVGMDHQAAQDRMQAAGLYNLRERDATGRGRLLVWDRNWVVVRQSPPPGTHATENTTVTLSSVKDGEQ
jgi:beta-lactam-binding protein with PASTA domain